MADMNAGQLAKELDAHETNIANHIKSAAIDGCMCEPCEAVREVIKAKRCKVTSADQFYMYKWRDEHANKPIDLAMMLAFAEAFNAHQTAELRAERNKPYTSSVELVLEREARERAEKALREEEGCVICGYPRSHFTHIDLPGRKGHSFEQADNVHQLAKAGWAKSRELFKELWKVRELLREMTNAYFDISQPHRGGCSCYACRAIESLKSSEGAK